MITKHTADAILNLKCREYPFATQAAGTQTRFAAQTLAVFRAKATAIKTNALANQKTSAQIL